VRADAIIEMQTEYHPDPLNPGSGYRTETPVRWEGGPIARLGWYEQHAHFKSLPHIGARFRFGSWCCVVIACDADPWPFVYITRDTHWAWWYIFRFWAARHWQPFKCRVIATCAVWGLAKYDWGASVSWSQIYAVAWLQKKLRRK